MMFTPCWPSAGPTGGAGLAAPAGTWSLTNPETFFAIGLVALQLGVVQFDRGRTSEQADFHLDLAFVVVDLLYGAREIREWAFRDFHHLTISERYFFLRLELFFHRSEAEDLVHFVVAQWLRFRAGAHELDHALDIVDHVHGALIRTHLHQHVARVEPARYRDA